MVHTERAGRLTRDEVARWLQDLSSWPSWNEPEPYRRFVSPGYTRRTLQCLLQMGSDAAKVHPCPLQDFTVCPELTDIARIAIDHAFRIRPITDDRDRWEYALTELIEGLCSDTESMCKSAVQILFLLDGATYPRDLEIARALARCKHPSTARYYEDNRLSKFVLNGREHTVEFAELQRSVGVAWILQFADVSKFSDAALGRIHETIATELLNILGFRLLLVLRRTFRAEPLLATRLGEMLKPALEALMLGAKATETTKLSTTQRGVVFDVLAACDRPTKAITNAFVEHVCTFKDETKWVASTENVADWLEFETDRMWMSNGVPRIHANLEFLPRCSILELLRLRPCKTITYRI